VEDELDAVRKPNGSDDRLPSALRYWQRRPTRRSAIFLTNVPGVRESRLKISG